MRNYVSSKFGKNTICQYEKCNKVAKFGYITYNNIYCSHHKTDKMSYTENMMCLVCDKVAIYGFINDKYPTNCLRHKHIHMLDRTFEYCSIENCSRQAMYIIDKEKEIYRCQPHRNANTNKINCIHRYIENGIEIYCYDDAEYSNKNDVSRTHCKLHKTKSMLKSRKNTCVECHLYSVYGYAEYGVTTHCVNHKRDGMDLLSNTKCIVSSCNMFTKTFKGDTSIIKNTKCYKHSFTNDTCDSINNDNSDNSDNSSSVDVKDIFTCCNDYTYNIDVNTNTNDIFAEYDKLNII